MASHRSFLILACSSMIALSACGTPVDPNMDKGQYWQRVHASESTYLRGPKAQQMLNRDISRCVVELRELERLGMVKNTMPVDRNGRVLDPDAAVLQDWDSPERNKHLYAEHTDYHDFESCMMAAGWERIKYVPYDVADRSRDDYLDSHVDYKYRSRIGERHEALEKSAADDNYDHLNE